MARTPPVMGQASPGMFETAAFWNANVKALGDWAVTPPLFSALQVTAQSVPTGAGASITWDTERIDSEGGHSTTTNPHLYTFQAAGTYLVMTNGTFSANSTGVRSVKLLQNGTVVQGSQVTSAPASTLQTTVPAWEVITAAAGDTVEVRLTHTVASALSTYVGVDNAPTIAVMFLSR